MSAQPAYADQYYNTHQPAPSQQSLIDEPKPNYDRLVSDYTSRSGEHRTFSVSVDPSRPSYPVGQKLSLSGSDYTSTTGKDQEHASSEPIEYPPLSHGIDSDPRPFWTKILPESLACRLYILTVLIQTTIDLAIEGDLLIRFNEALKNGQINESALYSSRRMPVYLSIFALAHVFQFAMAVDAVHARNTLQFICLTLFNLLFLAYAIVQIGEIRGSLKPTADIKGISGIPISALTAIIPIVISIAEIAYIALGWKIYNEFGWKVYKFLGADRRIKKMYATYQIFECIVKFDVFFWVGFSVQFIWLVLQKNDWEYYVTCAALPLSLILLLEGHLAARHENRWMMITFMSGCVGAMVYFIYKLAKVITLRNEVQFRVIFKSLSIFSVIAIVLLVLTFAFAIIVMRNFGRGLKHALSKKRSPSAHQRHPSHPLHARSPSTNLNRMTIE